MRGGPLVAQVLRVATTMRTWTPRWEPDLNTKDFGADSNPRETPSIPFLTQARPRSESLVMRQARRTKRSIPTLLRQLVRWISRRLRVWSE
jgi:hypothetical protein